jgi:DNA polymerase IV
MRDTASVLHVDLDAFFASVEQRDKPSLRGKPVIVGGVGSRGVVAAASYEARVFGVRSAMSIREARRRCPHAAFLSSRFSAYQQTSTAVMSLLREVSSVVEPLSLDEAFIDLTRTALPDFEVATLVDLAEWLQSHIAEVTGGLTASVGIGSSKLIAKIASEIEKPRGVVVVRPGTESILLHPMPVTVIPGIGPATAERLHRVGVRTVADLATMNPHELVRLVGQAHGRELHRFANAIDMRPVIPEREAKSISVESTYDLDLIDTTVMAGILANQSAQVATRLADHHLSGRTISIKVRLHDFTTLSRSATVHSPTDQSSTISGLARKLLADLDIAGGVRLLGVSVSGLAHWVQDDLFGHDADESEPAATPPAVKTVWRPGMDITHRRHGAGWVWGSGAGIVTVRFETRHSPAGPVRSFAKDDPDLAVPDRSELAQGSQTPDESEQQTETSSEG